MHGTPKVIVLDIDHTLIHPQPVGRRIIGPELYLHPEVAGRIADLRPTLGTTLVLATGRKFFQCLPVHQLLQPDWTLAEHGGLLINCHGQLDEPWYRELGAWVGQRSDQRVLRTGCLWDFWRNLSAEGFYFDCTGLTGFTVDLNVPCPNARAVAELPTRRPPAGLVTRVTRFHHLDVMPDIVNKGWALRKLLDRLAMSADAVAAVGDDLADQELLAAVALPCTFPNAHATCLDVVRCRQGFTATREQHAGIIEILDFLLHVPG